MSFFVPGSSYQTYYSYNNSGNPPKDSSFRHAFVQGQAPMLKINNSGGGGPTPTPPISTVNTLSPITGDGTVGNPVTLLAAPSSCQSTLFWDSGVWRFCVSPGISEVTVGDTANGANYRYVQDALNNGCTFIRVINNVNEPAALNLPSNTMIYVDPGVTLSLPGNIDLTGKRSLTLRGSTSIQAVNPPSTIIFQDGFKCDADTRLYFFDCRVENRGSGSLLLGSTNPTNYGTLQASNTSFLAANASPSLFGESKSPSTDTIILQLQNCIVEGGGNSCQFFVGYFNPNSAIINIQGLIVIGTIANKGILAATTTNECVLSNINVLASGSGPGNSFEWVIGGQINNFKQGTNFAYVQLNFQSSVNNLSNALIDSISPLSVPNVQMTNVVFGAPSAVQLGSSGYKISNAICPSGVTFSVSGVNNYLVDCQITGQVLIEGNQNSLSNIQMTGGDLLINGNQNSLSNIQLIGRDVLIDGFENIISNIQVSSIVILPSSGGLNQIINGIIENTTNIRASQNLFSNCWFQGDLTLDTGAVNNVIGNSRADAFITVNTGADHNSLTGGTKGRFSINGNNNTVSNWTDIISMTVDNNGNFIRLSNCSTPSSFIIRGPDCTIDSCTIGLAISLQAATCPRTIINNCRVDTSNSGGGIVVQNNNNVVISNCIIGVAGGGASINNCNLAAFAPPASSTATLLCNCYTASQILPLPATAVNCQVL